MKAKKLLSVLLVFVMCMSMVAGCGPKVRKIEGASKDAEKMVAAIEKQYNMVGSKMVFKGEANDSIINGSQIVDKNGNMKIDISMNYYDAESKVTIDGEIASIMIVDKVLYLDLNGFYEQLKNYMKEQKADINEYLSLINMKEEDLAKMLVLKLELGDVDLSFISPKGQQKMVQKIMDILAVAVSEAECLDAFKGTYSVKSKNNAEKLAMQLILAFLNQGEALFDASSDYVKSMNLTAFYDTVTKKVLENLMAKAEDEASKKLVESMKAPIEEYKKQVSNYELNVDSNRGTFVTLVNQLKPLFSNPAMSAAVGFPKGLEFSFSVTDTKGGNEMKSYVSFDGATIFFNSTLEEYKDEVKAPAEATDITEIVAKYLLPLLGAFGGMN